MSKIDQYIKEGKTIVTVDESGFEENMYRSHGYSHRGKRCMGLESWHPSKRINAIGALIGKELVTVSLFEFNINTQIFNSWVEQDLLPKLTGVCVIVLDNAAFHKSPLLLKMVTQKGHILEYLPPYSPDLSPIEPKWQQAKSKMRRYGCDIDTLFQVHMA